MKKIIPVLCFLSVFLLSCLPSVLRDVPELSFFPTQIDISELTVRDAPAEFSAVKTGTLYGPLLNASSSFAVYRGTYAAADDQDAVFTADIVRTENRMDAYALLTGLRSDKGSYIPECRGFADEVSGVSVSGRYFFHVTVSKPTLSSQAVIRSLLLFFNKTIPSGQGDPGLSIADIFSAPEKPLHFYSIVNEEFFGLESVFGGRVSVEGKDVKLFYALFPSEMQAQARYTSILGSKKGFVVLESGSIHSAWIKDDLRTYSFLVQKDRWIYGVLSAASLDEGRKALANIGARLKAE